VAKFGHCVTRLADVFCRMLSLLVISAQVALLSMTLVLQATRSISVQCRIFTDTDYVVTGDSN